MRTVFGVDKTPEWAEKICAIPAETIRELARLVGSHHGYSDKNPCFFKAHWPVSRVHEGENISRAAQYFNAITGNMGVPGTTSNGADLILPLAEGHLEDYEDDYNMRNFPESLRKATGLEALPREYGYAVRAFIAGSMALVADWIADGCQESPEDLTEIIIATAPQSLASFFENE